MTHPFYLMFGIMVVAGFLGGGLNYLLSWRDNAESAAIWQSLVGGLVASFMVPLFLNMISSNLVDSIKGIAPNAGDPSKLFVFAGFCLVAAVSSKAFINTLSHRILSETKATNEKVEQLKNEVDPIIAKETEKESPEPTSMSVSLADRMTVLGENQKKVLQALASGKFTLRTRTGICKDTGLPREEVIKTLEELETEDLARSAKVLVRGELKTRWYATEEGRAVETVL
jgi:hypothetical protein